MIFPPASKAKKYDFVEGLKGRIIFQIAGKMKNLVRAESMISLHVCFCVYLKGIGHFLIFFLR